MRPSTVPYYAFQSISNGTIVNVCIDTTASGWKRTRERL